MWNGIPPGLAMGDATLCRRKEEGMSKDKGFGLRILSGLLSAKPKRKVKIDTKPIAAKKESLEISKQRLNRMKGKGARENRGSKRRKG